MTPRCRARSRSACVATGPPRAMGPRSVTRPLCPWLTAHRLPLQQPRQRVARPGDARIRGQPVLPAQLLELQRLFEPILRGRRADGDDDRLAALVLDLAQAHRLAL